MKFPEIFQKKSLFDNFKLVFLLFFIVTVALSLQSLLLPGRAIPNIIGIISYHNNYVIFKHSFFHLINGQDLYRYYHAEQYDLYKYSPTFALLFGLLAYLPDSLGLIVWNLINAMCLFIAIHQLPAFDTEKKILMMLFVLIELTTNIQSAQSNALIAGLILMSFTMLEKRQYLWATFLITFTVYIKLFGLFALVLFIFFPEKPKLITYTVFWIVVLGLLPLVAIPADQLELQYNNWLTLLISDHDGNSGTSVMGWLETWFHLSPDKNTIVLAGFVILVLPLIRYKISNVPEFKLLTLASILIWVVIFNHRAESPTFIIAVTGVAIWYFSQARNWINLTLLVLVFVFTSLSPTDLFPGYIQENILEPYEVKVVPCILVWFKIIYDSFRLEPRSVTLR